MTKADLHNMQGEKAGKVDLPEEVFNVKVNPDLIYQVTRVQMLFRRQGSAHTKDRSEVRGGGRKPWRQKGTGRARHGSSRSPIWKGGGVTFGARKERNYKKKINKRMKRSALFMVLSAKREKDMIFFVSDVNIKEPKTKEVREFLKNNFQDKSILLVLPEIERNIILATRNLKNVDTIQAQDINALDLLSYKYLVIPQASIGKIKENFLGPEGVEEQGKDSGSAEGN